MSVGAYFNVLSLSIYPFIIFVCVLVNQFIILSICIYTCLFNLVCLDSVLCFRTGGQECSALMGASPEGPSRRSRMRTSPASHLTPGQKSQSCLQTAPFRDQVKHPNCGCHACKCCILRLRNVHLSQSALHMTSIRIFGQPLNPNLA